MIIIDAFNMIYRAAGISYSKPEKEWLYNDINKEILQKFFKMFNRIYRNFKDEKIYIAWDNADDNFRKIIYPDYKANRKNKMEVSAEVFEKIKKGLKLYGAKILEYSGAEGDDIVYTFCLFNNNEQIIVISGDNDFIQLLEQFSNVKLYNSLKQKYMEKPNYNFILYKAIKGDNSDNIKGLSGYGEKKTIAVVYNNEVYNNFYNMLCEEHKNIIARNISIIDLSKNPNVDKILDYIKKEMNNNDDKKDSIALKEFYKENKLKNLYMDFGVEIKSFL